MLAVTILGNNSAVPSGNRHPTAQIVQTQEHSFLLDCGEGTQMQMNRYKIKRNKINHIFISHLHGDHFFGLIGLLNSYALHGRTTDLHLHAPAALRDVIRVHQQVSQSVFPYSLIFHELEREEVLVAEKNVRVFSFRVNHRIDCWGFVVEEVKTERKINPDATQEFLVPLSAYGALKRGEDVVNTQGILVPNHLVTIPNPPGKSYAYCADTIYDEGIAQKIAGVDMIYHETTYMHELQERARSRYHSTTREAAQIAVKAGVKRLLIGHYSSIYNDVHPLELEAREIFENTEATVEGTCYLI